MIPFPNKRYNTIYADPPWAETGGGKIRRGADRHYKLMSTSEIKKMAPQVRAISNENCHLYLWVTNTFLQAGLDVMEAWGFVYKTKITWKKNRFGLGQYFRGITEDCLFGVRGVLPYKTLNGKRQQGVTGFDAPRTKHSKKPEEMRTMIQKVSYPPYIELFAREPYEDWDVWGNEVETLSVNRNVETFRDTQDFAGGGCGPNIGEAENEIKGLVTKPTHENLPHISENRQSIIKRPRLNQ